jgi:hypothetical protein
MIRFNKIGPCFSAALILRPPGLIKAAPGKSAFCLGGRGRRKAYDADAQTRRA